MWLSSDDFRLVVASTPLISIDFIVKNPQGWILLGQRLNKPAQDYWFVPGGRILKDESFDAAFQRLSRHELGEEFSRPAARLLGIYEHFYHDSIFDCHENMAMGTHYVVMAYQLVLDVDQVLSPPLVQHGQYRWWTAEEIRTSPDVHDNTRAYFEVHD